MSENREGGERGDTESHVGVLVPESRISYIDTSSARGLLRGNDVKGQLQHTIAENM
jgi:hypothetical protein